MRASDNEEKDQGLPRKSVLEPSAEYKKLFIDQKPLQETIHYDDGSSEVEITQHPLVTHLYTVPSKKDEEHKLYQKAYSKMDDLFREDSDAQFGIVSNVIEDKQKYPTGVAFVRDATHAKSLNDPTINHCRVDANNTLLRALGRLRSIDYVLMKQWEETQDLRYLELRKRLKHDFDQLIIKVYAQEEKLKDIYGHSTPLSREKYESAFNLIETEFNTELCLVLHEANLDEGCLTSEDYESLLFHYRNLSALLDPAKSLVTMTYDSENRVLHRRTEDPIAAKLQSQKVAIRKEMSQVTTFAAEAERTFQTAQNKGKQVANQCFSELAASDDRMLGAQTRKSHLHGLRNTFCTTSEVIFLGEEEKLTEHVLLTKRADREDTYRFVRGGTLVYIGKGESDERLQVATKENLEQMRQFVKVKRAREEQTEPSEIKQTIHSMGFVTAVWGHPDSENQNLMIDHTRRVTEADQNTADGFTVASTNFEGLKNPVELSRRMTEKGFFERSKENLGRAIGSKKKRIKQIVSIAMEIMGRSPDVIEHLFCASGQDRTGGAGEAVVQECTMQSYTRHGKTPGVVQVSREAVDAIEALSIGSHHTAVLTAHVVGGSPACKKDSHAKGLFSKASDNVLYTPTANTNKKNKVDAEKLKTKLSKTSAIARDRYEKAKLALTNECSVSVSDEKNNILSELRESGRAICQRLSQDSNLSNEIDPYDLFLLTEALAQSSKLLQSKPFQSKNNLTQYTRDVERLDKIAKKIDRRSAIRKYSALFLKLAGIAILTAAILTAVLSGGASLLALGFGLKALGFAAPIMTAITAKSMIATGGAFVAGAGGALFGKKLEKKESKIRDSSLTAVSQELRKFTKQSKNK